MGFFKKFTNKFTAPDVDVILKLNNYGVALGDALEGTVTVTPKEDFDSTETRIEIQCTEQAKVMKSVYDSEAKHNVPKEVTESACLFSARPSLQGPTRMANGQAKELPVKFVMPVGARPTYQSIERHVSWNVKAVVAVDGRPDATSRTMEIQVAPAAAQAVIKEKEVIREVVLIPCKYCNGLMPQTETSCPNCGAKRTA